MPDELFQSRYGRVGCPCGHIWEVHDVYEYPGDESEMCCITGCAQQGCPGKKPPNECPTCHGEGTIIRRDPFFIGPCPDCVLFPLGADHAG
jgi:hypothetical protein